MYNLLIYIMFSNFVINNLRCSYGQKKDGVQLGGDYIINNLNFNTKLINNILINNIESYKIAYDKILEGVKRKEFILNLGGDHSIGLPTVQAVLDEYKDEILIIWIDAHGDINTYETSPSQNLHGMPVAGLMGLMKNWIDDKEHYKLKPNNIIYIGVRDLDKGEEDFINKLGIKCFRTLNEEVLKLIKNHKSKYIHISCDIDGLDPKIMPSTGTKSEKGLKIDNIFDIIQVSRDRLISYDLVEFNPLEGSENDKNITLSNILIILNYLLG